MREIGAFEAKNTLGHLLDLVEQGEEIVITRRGKATARARAPAGAIDQDRSQAAVRRIRQLRKGAILGGIPIKELIAEGRSRPWSSMPR